MEPGVEEANDCRGVNTVDTHLANDRQTYGKLVREAGDIGCIPWEKLDRCWCMESSSQASRTQYENDAQLQDACFLFNKHGHDTKTQKCPVSTQTDVRLIEPLFRSSRPALNLLMPRHCLPVLRSSLQPLLTIHLATTAKHITTQLLSFTWTLSSFTDIHSS